MDSLEHDVVIPNDLESHWMPYTANRQYKADPRMVVSAEGLYYTSHDGRKILDSSAGLWCSSLGHRHPKVVEAIKSCLDRLDYAPPFGFGHHEAFELTNKIVGFMPGDLNKVMFCNSGSEAADTALKMALAYHKLRGDGSRTRFIGRERGYHGVGFGGISVGGMTANRKMFGNMLAGVDHLPHTHDLERNRYSRGLPEHGAELADDLEKIVALHDASTIAAVIVEPVAGSTGVLPPPKGYLKRLREICDKYGILLIFDEVITAWGRLGHATASERFDVIPDILTSAKGLTSAHVPMGAVVARDYIYQTFMQGPKHAAEFFHGYTYSAHPLACAAGLATLDVYREEGIFEHAQSLEQPFEDMLHELASLDCVTDVRNIGLMGAVDIAPIPGEPSKRAFNAMTYAYENGMMLRTTGDTVAFSPPLVSEVSDVEMMVSQAKAAILSAY